MDGNFHTTHFKCQVVAVSVFLALGFAFYVFFAPFVGKKLYQYIILSLYTPLIVSVFGLYIWCAASNPVDSGVFKSKKYLKTSGKGEYSQTKDLNLEGEFGSSKKFVNDKGDGDKPMDSHVEDTCVDREKEDYALSCLSSVLGVLFFPCTSLSRCMSSSNESTGRQTIEDEMFYCSLCEVEVFKNSKHCRVCDKCVDSFDHHCRWLNNCIGKRNYRKFFTLMVVALLLLIIQWSTGILVLIRSFLEKKRFKVDIVAKLGSSFSIVPFIIVVAVCTVLAMIATLPIVQLFFFHIILIKKGLSTYDYIVALREQEEQEVGGGQSPQTSQVSSFTGLSSASLFTTFKRGAWCTPPRFYLENQFNVVPPDTLSVSSSGKKAVIDEPTKKKNPTVKISPWTLARLNAEQVSKAATEAKNKSKILQPVIRRDGPFNLEQGPIFGTNQRVVSRPDHTRRRNSKRINFPGKTVKASSSSSTNLAPLQVEARSAFLAMSSGAHMVGSSPDSSIDSPEVHPSHISSSRTEELGRVMGLLETGGPVIPETPLSRSTSDGYEPSGGEDSDQVTTRPMERTVNWSSLLFGSNQDETMLNFNESSGFSLRKV